MEPTADDFKKSGNEAFLGGRYEEAIALFTMGLELAEDNEVLYSNRSGAYYKMGKYTDALEDAETVLRLKPEWARGFSRKAAALEGLGQDQEALKLYTESLKRDTSNQAVKTAVENLAMRLERDREKRAEESTADAKRAAELQATGNAHKKEGEFEKAAEAYTEALQFQKNDEKRAALYSNLSAVRLLQDQPEAALDAAHRCVELRPEWVRGYTRRGAALWALKRYSQARAAYTEAMAHDTSNAAEVQQIIAKIEGEQRVAEMEAANPDDPSTIAAAEKLKGNQALKENRLSDALEHYSKGLEAEPRNHILLSNRAAVYLQMGYAEKSLEDAIQCTQIENKFAKGFARKGAAIEALSVPPAVHAAVVEGADVDYSGVDSKRLRGAVKAFLDAAELPGATSEAYLEKAFALEKIITHAEEAAVEREVEERLATEAAAEEEDNALMKGVLVATSTDKSKTHQVAIVEEPEVQGDRKYEVENWRGAIGFYSQALKKEPTYTLYMKRGLCWSKVRRFQKALADFTAAVELNPNHSEPYWQKGNVLIRMAGQELNTDPHAAGPHFDEALKMLQAGRALDTDVPSRFDDAIAHAQNEKAAFEMTKADRIAVLERTQAKGKSRSKLDWKNMPEEELKRRKEDMKRKAEAALFESDSYLQKQIRRGNLASVGVQQQRKRAKKFHSGVQSKYTFTDGGI